MWENILEILFFSYLFIDTQIEQNIQKRGESSPFSFSGRV
jgi:hypothetical protein